jgi:hypothetical protein
MYLTMKLGHSLALLIMAALTMPSALADFHILAGVQLDTSKNDVIACPSNYYNCKCFYGGQRRASIGGALSNGHFSTVGNLCGVGQLDFYKRSDGHWEFYKHNGDGSLQGTCYSNTGGIEECNGPPDAYFYEQLVCYSYICNH